MDMTRANSAGEGETILVQEGLAAGELDVYRRHPFAIVRGEGYRLWTDDGRELVDFYGGHATTLLGYGHPGLVEGISQQARELFFQTNAVEVESRRRAAEKLAGFAPAPLSQVFFVNSGAEANENALKLACRTTGRGHVVAIRGGFHGRTAAAAACTDSGVPEAANTGGFPRAPFDVTWVAPNERSEIEEAVGPHTAAIIFEPVQGMGGALCLTPEYLKHLSDVATRAGACLIADEIQCGMGRTGQRFAIEASGVEVDFLTTAKGLAGGFPAGAMLTSESIARTVAPGDLGTTFGGGPLATRLIEVVIDALEAPGFLDHVRACELEIRSRLEQLGRTAVQGRGLLLGIRTVAPAREVLSHLLENGVLAGGARDPHIVRLTPPLIVDAEAIERLITAWEEAPA